MLIEWERRIQRITMIVLLAQYIFSARIRTGLIFQTEWLLRGGVEFCVGGDILLARLPNAVLAHLLGKEVWIDSEYH